MASRASDAAALLTPSLLAQTVSLHAELASVIERSRDLRWWSQQLRTRSALRPIRGGACVDDAALVLSMITRVSLCQPCIALKSGIPEPRVDDILRTLVGMIVL